jgi:hypothetical protein
VTGLGLWVHAYSLFVLQLLYVPQCEAYRLSAGKGLGVSSQQVSDLPAEADS